MKLIIHSDKEPNQVREFSDVSGVSVQPYDLGNTKKGELVVLLSDPEEGLVVVRIEEWDMAFLVRD